MAELAVNWWVLFFLQTFNDPSLTAYELEKQKMILIKDMTMPESAMQILSIIEEFKHAPQHEEWVCISSVNSYFTFINYDLICLQLCI